MADETIAFLETVVGEPADLVGHSNGALAAMLVGMQRPELVKRLVLMSCGFNKSGESVPDAEWNVDQIFEFLGPSYGEVSPDPIDHFKMNGRARVKCRPQGHWFAPLGGTCVLELRHTSLTARSMCCSFW